LRNQGDVASEPQPALSEDALASVAAMKANQAAAQARINEGRTPNQVGSDAP
jgi:hypothetical protein